MFRNIIVMAAMAGGLLVGSQPTTVQSKLSTHQNAQELVHVPSAPRNFRAVKVESTKVHLKWQAPRKGPCGTFHVEMREIAEEKPSMFRTVCEGPEPECLVEKLQSNTHYLFRVQARNAAGEGQAAKLHVTTAP
jgi:hypothetical protein